MFQHSIKAFWMFPDRRRAGNQFFLTCKTGYQNFSKNFYLVIKNFVFETISSFRKKLTIMHTARFIELSMEILGSSNPLYNTEQIASNDTIMIFDIDYCLYQNPDMYDAEKRFNIETMGNLGIDYESSSWKEYVKSCGSSKRALHEQFRFTLEKISKEYDFQDVEPYLKPNPYLKRLLKIIKCKKFCFTNGFRTKAEKILRCLDLLDCFVSVFCAGTDKYDFVLKPADKAYEKVEELLGITSENRPKIIFFDDSESNCKAAIRHGWIAILVQAPKKIEDYLWDYIVDPVAFEEQNRYKSCSSSKCTLDESIIINEQNPISRQVRMGDNSINIPFVNA